MDGHSYTGSCKCGAVRYEFMGPVEETYHCYCGTCRRLHSAAYVTWTVLPHRRFHLVSGRRSVTFCASSEREHRAFCRKCGSHVFAEAIEPNERQDIYVPVATVVEPHDLQPKRNIFADRRPGWVALDDALPSYGGADGVQPLSGEASTDTCGRTRTDESCCA